MVHRKAEFQNRPSPSVGGPPSKLTCLEFTKQKVYVWGSTKQISRAPIPQNLGLCVEKTVINVGMQET